MLELLAQQGLPGVAPAQPIATNPSEYLVLYCVWALGGAFVITILLAVWLVRRGDKRLDTMSASAETRLDRTLEEARKARDADLAAYSLNEQNNRTSSERAVAKLAEAVSALGSRLHTRLDDIVAGTLCPECSVRTSHEHGGATAQPSGG